MMPTKVEWQRAWRETAAKEITEHDKAKSWRLAHNWSLDDLAELTGYSRTSIVFFERGRSGKDQPIDEFAFYRYKRICQAIEMGLQNQQFEWGT